MASDRRLAHLTNVGDCPTLFYMTTTHYAVGDKVTVLNAIRLPQEHSIGEGIIDRITYQSSDGQPLYWVRGFAIARTGRVLRPVVAHQLADNYSLTEHETTVTYTLTLTVTRPVGSWKGNDTAEELADCAVWMQNAKAKRELEREVLRALRKLDGDCDCEVIETTVQS